MSTKTKVTHIKLLSRQDISSAAHKIQMRFRVLKLKYSSIALTEIGIIWQHHQAHNGNLAQTITDQELIRLNFVYLWLRNCKKSFRYTTTSDQLRKYIEEKTSKPISNGEIIAVAVHVGFEFKNIDGVSPDLIFKIRLR
jgi:hypothetical protein